MNNELCAVQIFMNLRNLHHIYPSIIHQVKLWGPLKANDHLEWVFSNPFERVVEVKTPNTCQIIEFLSCVWKFQPRLRKNEISRKVKVWGLFNPRASAIMWPLRSFCTPYGASNFKGDRRKQNLNRDSRYQNKNACNFLVQGLGS